MRETQWDTVGDTVGLSEGDTVGHSEGDTVEETVLRHGKPPPRRWCLSWAWEEAQRPDAFQAIRQALPCTWVSRASPGGAQVTRLATCSSPAAHERH
jgi:hypothetical protein